MLPAVVGLDRALGPEIREVGLCEEVDHAPGVHRRLADQLAADRLPDVAAGAVASHDVLGADAPLFALARSRGVAHVDPHGVVAAAGHLEAQELDAVVRHRPRGGLGRELGEVVLHPSLVEQEVRELAGAGRVVGHEGRAHDVLRVAGVRLPEGHRVDPVGLLDQPVGEPEGLEGLDASGLEAVCLSHLEPVGASLDQARGDVGELGELREGGHARGTSPHDQRVHLVGQLLRTVQADAGRRLDPRVTGDVAVVVKLHTVAPEFYNRTR